MGRRYGAAPRPFGEAQPQVFYVRHRLLEQLRDVMVVERVVDPPALALPGHQAEVPEDPQLVGDGRAVHPDRGADLAHRARALVQAGEDPQPARGRQRLHRLGDLTRGVEVEELAWIGGRAVAHAPQDT
jgi:hypothetical protein